MKLSLSPQPLWVHLAAAFTIETSRISALVRASSARRTEREDIPVARRTRPPRQRKGNGTLGLLLGLVLVCAGSLALLMVAPTLLSRRQPTQSLEISGFRERPDADGRLLGHFPYGEAEADQLIVFQPGIELNLEAAEALDTMMRSASADGVDLRLLSGFRSLNLQESIFFDVASERNQTAEERAQVSAPPGYSEHSTGYAVDLGDGRVPETNLSQSFQDTDAFRWLQDHAARYHFVLSFPEGNQQGVMYEPWHWRYEGNADALRLFEAARRFSRRDP